MFTEIKTELIPLTMQVAKHYRRMQPLKGDRDITTTSGRRRVNKLRELNIAGIFHSPEWSTVQVASEKGKKYRVDGAHSTQMLVESGVDFPEGRVVFMRHFHAIDIDEAVYLWEQFNPQVSTRSTTDVAKNRAAYVPELGDIKPTAVLVAARGIAAHLAWQGACKRKDALDYIGIYPEFIVFAQEFVHIAILKKSGVLAAMFAAWGKDSDKAGLFWRRVRDDSGTEATCPTRVLRKYLDGLRARAKVGGACDVPFMQYVKCHHAWNAWRKGTTTKLNYIQGCPVPRTI